MCRLSSLSVHCLCLAVSLGVLACVLFGLGTACLSLSDHGLCPHQLVVTVISVAGVLVVIAGSFATAFICCRHQVVKWDGSSTETAALTPKEVDISLWEMTQSPRSSGDCGATYMEKNATAVRHWIEHQVDVSCKEIFAEDDINRQDEMDLDAPAEMEETI